MGIRTLPSLGTVTKKERLSVADHLNGVPVLVLETTMPYAGYYGTTVPDKEGPGSLFLVTRHHYNDDKVIRFVQGVKKTFARNFDGVPGNITLVNRSYPVIRIRFFPSEHMSALVFAFREQGAEFVPKMKISPSEGLIRITKYFNTEEVEDGIFLDTDNNSVAYLQVDEHIRWSSFETITRHVKNNIEGLTFDAAQAIMYDCSGILDFVRIYDENRSVDKLKEIRNKYLEAIRKA